MTDFRSFVMFAEMRTGSNFLEANLNALPGVLCHGEVFNPHFIGRQNQSDLFGLTLADRDADPLAFLARMRDQTPGMAGFRYFHDHDPRVFDAVIADRACAKIVLTRNPVESYVSWKIAQTTGQWKLTNPKMLRQARATFDGAEFEAHVVGLQAFQMTLVHALQVTGQTAFWIDYDDVQDLAVLNGLAAFLGLSARLDALDPKLKKQNPEAIADKVENPGAIAAALARLDRFNLARTPNFEPRRAPAIPSFVGSGGALFMPLRSGVEARVEGWLGGFGPLVRDFTQKTLKQWRADATATRSFAVLRHPLLRAHDTCFNQVLTGDLPEFRTGLSRTMQIDLPPPHKVGKLAHADRQAIFLAFLRFARLNLSGQTALRVPAPVATQTALLQGFAQFQGPDLTFREDRLEQGLAFLAAELGKDCPPLPPDAGTGPLDAIVTPEIQDAAHDTYARDYQGYGFSAPWRPGGNR
ncbi:MAG: nodulation protein NodH [Gemmobacter sp.]